MQRSPRLNLSFNVQSLLIGGLSGFLGLLESLWLMSVWVETEGQLPPDSLIPAAPFFFIPPMICALLGLTGAIIAYRYPKWGGIFLLGTTVVPSGFWLMVVGLDLVSADSIIVWSFVIFILFWWQFGLLLAGVIAIPRTRIILKRLRKGGWLP